MSDGTAQLTGTSSVKPGPEDEELQEEVMESPAAMREAADFTLKSGLAILAWLENAEEEKGFALI